MRLEAARAERDRLARTVHDGVLQTLAFINRRAIDIGGETAALGAMAGEQERILRTLVSQADLSEVDRAVSGEADLRGLLAHVETDDIALVAPAEPVLLPRRVADEVVAAVEAAVDNVRKHAGERARAWVLLDDDGARGCRSRSATPASESRRVGWTRQSARAASASRRASSAGSPTSGAQPASASGAAGGTTVELRVPHGGAR